MLPEIGQFSLMIAFALVLLQIILPIIGIVKNDTVWMQSCRSLVLGQSFFLTLSILILFFAFAFDDFSVVYVAKNSNSALPFFYKLSALWGAHEGSLLLWVWILSGWTGAVVLAARHLPIAFLARICVILGLVSAGFLLFLLATSNPFWRYLPNYPLDGRDLNPLLQDLGLVIHPPLLYMGYVGFSVPFAFALSALWSRSMELPWAKWMRSWTLSAFSFLTVGIALGSWWAYYELGWGGWWFWDPVENASLMPWLVGLALVHALMMSDKRRVFQGWTLLLAIITFAFSLLGAFLVRSGILTSVHAFASDPARGVFLLELLVVVIGGSLALYAAYGKRLISTGQIEPWSRETLMLVFTLLLTVATAAVFLGTLFPILNEILTGQKLSVGFPYFNNVFIPCFIPILLLIPVGPIIKWGKNSVLDLMKKIQVVFVVSILLAIILPLVFTQKTAGLATIGLALGVWVVLATLQTGYEKSKQKGGILKLSQGAYGMILAHAGMGVLVIGISMVSHFEIERDVALSVGETLVLNHEKIKFMDLRRVEGSNFMGYQGDFLLAKAGGKGIHLYPEKRTYVVQGTTLTETAIDPGLWRDIYLSLGEPLDQDKRKNTKRWSIRAYYKPFIRWIWGGALLMAAGGLLAALGRRQKGVL